MINFKFAASYVATVDGGEKSVPQAESNRITAGSSHPYPARGGVVRPAHNSRWRDTIIEAAKPVVIKQIIALYGGDLPDPIAHAHYLDTLTFPALCDRRDQLLRERQPELFDGGQL